MAEELPAIMHIGGRVKRDRIPDLLDAIRGQGLSWHYDEYDIDATDAASLLTELEKLGLDMLQVGSAQANYGRFPVVEEYCQRHGIAYDILADPKDSEHGGFCARWRPGMGEEPEMTGYDGSEETVAVESLEPVYELLVQASSRASRSRNNASRVRTIVNEALELLDRVFSRVPNLEPLEIIDGT